jgi:hypothetical protein
LYFCIILHGEILPGRPTDTLSPHSPPRVWFGSWPFRYILLCPPLGSVVGRGIIRVRNWRVFWGRITSASDARSSSLVFLSAGFGALCSGVSSRSLPLCYMYYRYISGSALWESPREREVRARTPRNVTQVLPYGQSRVPRNLRQDASWEHLPLPLLLCPPSPVASKVIRPVGRCALLNFERPSPAPY